MNSKIIFVISILIMNSCIAQVTKNTDNIKMEDYPAYYSNLVGKLNKIIPHKTDYYGKPLEYFLQEIEANNIKIKAYDPGSYDNHLLRLSFIWNADLRNKRYEYNYVEPYIEIYFKTPFNYDGAMKVFNNQYYSYWNPAAQNFYKNLIIEKIEFWYVNGVANKTNIPK